MSHSAKPSGIVRQLCDPSWYKARFHDADGAEARDLVVISSECPAVGLASKDESAQLVSPSFQPFLAKMLPLPPRPPGESGFAEVGGDWFWETYRHALFGENLVVHLNGTGTSLAEDSLDAQAAVRQHACSSSSSALPSKGLVERTLRHGSAKLEVVCAIALSVSLHVARQPLLELGQGPQALVLCATKDQCDEFAFVLNQFAASLHLVVHNLFEPYPPVPSDKRAEIVVATAPLWEGLAQFVQGTDRVRVSAAAPANGLEDILLHVEGSGQLPPTYDLTRFRPYSLAHVAQLVLFDIDLQVNMGFAPLVQRLLRSVFEPASRSRHNGSAAAASSLPLACQLHAVGGGDRFVNDAGALRSLFELVVSSGRLRSNVGTAEVLLRCSRPASSSASGGHGVASPMASKRPRTEEHPTGDDSTLCADRGGFEGLLIRGALSHARLLADFTAFTDFVGRVTDEAREFWASFDGASRSAATEAGSNPCPEGTQRHSEHSAESDFASAALVPPPPEHVRVDLALLCGLAPNAIHDDCGELEVSVGVQPTEWHAQELAVWVHPAAGAPPSLFSRLTLLYQHLHDRLHGESFDGSVVQCVLASDAARLPFTILTGAPASVTVSLNEAFRYGPHLAPPVFLLMTRKPTSGMADAAATRSADRLLALSRVTDSSVTAQGHGRIPPYFFLQTKSETVAGSPTPSPSYDDAPNDVNTVLVLRSVAQSREELCDSGSQGQLSHALQAETKPHALYLLEECCQYGRVLSYFVHEAAAAGRARVEDSPVPTSATTASVFVEFCSGEAAVEAVRLFSRRFQLPPSPASPTQPSPRSFPRARLFKNRTYYEGVAQELAASDDTRTDGARSSDYDDADTDSLFDELLRVSLLAE